MQLQQTSQIKTSENLRIPHLVKRVSSQLACVSDQCHTGRNFKISSRVRYLKESGTGYISTSSKMVEMKRNTENETESSVLILRLTNLMLRLR